MKWISNVQTSESFETALLTAVAEIKKKAGRTKLDLGLIFISSHMRDDVIDLWPTLRKEIPISCVIGCTAGGVIGGDQEIEDKPAVSLIAASLPNVRMQAFDLKQESLPSIDGSPKPWRDLLQTGQETDPQFILLSDPFSIDADMLVSGLDFAYPNSIKVGGLSSGARAPKENLLIHNEKIMNQGAVGVSLSGNISVEPVVAQGCRPIGDPMTITKCQDNILLEINNEPPLRYLSSLYEKLNDRDRSLLTNALFLGLLTDSFKTNPKQGDYLIRNIIGLDQERGLLAIGAPLRRGQMIQFHLRDANTSHDDLKLMLSRVSSEKNPSSGAVLFSCLGRGHRLYGKPDHDIGMMKSMMDNIPVAGFFCNGEIGPISGKTYLHGYTSSIAIFSERMVS